MRLEILAAVLRNQQRHLVLIIHLVDQLIGFPTVIPICLYRVGSLKNRNIGEEPKLLSRMENIWGLKDEVKEDNVESGVHVGVPGVLACITCYKMEEGHDNQACKLREETRIINACKEIDDMIERNKEHVERLEKVENDLLRMLVEMELRPRV